MSASLGSIFRLILSLFVLWGGSSAHGDEQTCHKIELGEAIPNVGDLYRACLVSANNGNASAQWTVSLISRFMVCNKSPAEDDSIANAWQSVAAENKSPEALVYIATNILSGLGVSISSADAPKVESAVLKLQQAAQLNSAEAYYELYRLQRVFAFARPSISGLGNFREAVGNLLKASQLGSADASNTLAHAYLWAEKGRLANSSATELDSSLTYERDVYGPIVKELSRTKRLASNFGKAAETHFLQAAMLGHEGAMKELALGYGNGLFGRADVIEANAWSALAIFGDTSDVSGETNAAMKRFAGAGREAVCTRIRQITSESRFVPATKVSITVGPGANSIVAKCTSGGETYGLRRSCLLASELIWPNYSK